MHSVSFLKSFRTVLLCGAWVISASSAQSTDKVVEFLPMAPLALSDDGVVISQLDGTGEIFGWDSATQKQSLIYRYSQPGVINPFGSYLRSLDISADKSRMLLVEAFEQHQIAKVFDLTHPTFASAQILETRIFNRIPRLSPEADRYSFSGILSTDFFDDGLEVFNLAEYLWDAENGVLQPTGFYIDSVRSPSTSATAAAWIGEQAWSADGTELAYWEESGNSTDAWLMVYDFLLKKSRKIISVKAPITLHWPNGNFIYYTSKLRSGFQLFRIDLQKKTKEAMHAYPIESLSLNFSSDGKWAAYTAMESGVLAAELLDLTTEQYYVLRGCLSPRLSSDGTRLAVQRTGLSPKKKSDPLWIINVRDVVGATSKEIVNLGKIEKSFRNAGVSVPSYEFPKEKADFQKSFRMENFAVKPYSRHVAVSAELMNISSKYYTMNLSMLQTSYCRMEDEQGKVLVRSSPMPFLKLQRYISVPSRALKLNCSLSIPSLLPSGTKAKVILFLDGYKETTKLEQQIVL